MVNGEKLDPSDAANKTECISKYGIEAWQNSKINFDNSLMAFFALYQVVSTSKLWTYNYENLF